MKSDVKKRTAGFGKGFAGIQEKFVGMKNKIAGAGGREDEGKMNETGGEDGMTGGEKSKEGRKFRITKKQGIGIAIVAAGIAALLSVRYSIHWVRADWAMDIALDKSFPSLIQPGRSG